MLLVNICKNLSGSHINNWKGSLEVGGKEKKMTFAMFYYLKDYVKSVMVYFKQRVRGTV